MLFEFFAKIFLVLNAGNISSTFHVSIRWKFTAILDFFTSFLGINFNFLTNKSTAQSRNGWKWRFIWVMKYCNVEIHFSLEKDTEYVFLWVNLWNRGWGNVSGQNFLICALTPRFLSLKTYLNNQYKIVESFAKS